MALCSCVLNGVSMFLLLRTCIVHFCAELHCCTGWQALVGNSVLLHRRWLIGSKRGLIFDLCSQWWIYFFVSQKAISLSKCNVLHCLVYCIVERFWRGWDLFVEGGLILSVRIAWFSFWSTQSKKWTLQCVNTLLQNWSLVDRVALALQCVCLPHTCLQPGLGHIPIQNLNVILICLVFAGWLVCLF